MQNSLPIKNMPGFDFVRAFAIFFVFIAHSEPIHNSVVLVTQRSISPGLTMSVLGFISAYLLTSKYHKFDGRFYVKRFTRIYSSLIVCLSLITILHLFMSYDVINQHSIIHFMGLTFFMSLFQVSNKSSLGGGLWFVTIINIMYLLLPLFHQIYAHKYKRIHLFIIILICLLLNKIMYNTASSWNVVVAFNIGCFVGFNSNIDNFTNKKLSYYIFITVILLILAGFATLKIIPYEIRELLLPFYPFFAFPMLYKIGIRITGGFRKAIVWFSSISYEVYILHFYFINNYLFDIFPGIKSMSSGVFISIIIVLPLAYGIAKVSFFLSNSINNYFLS